MEINRIEIKKKISSMIIISMLWILIFLIVNSISPAEEIISTFAIITIFIGLFSIYVVSKHLNSVINIYNAFFLIWMVFIPVTSFEYPMMARMVNEDWNYCLIGALCILLGMLVAIFVCPIKFKTKYLKSKNLTGLEYSIYMVLFLIGIITQLLDVYLKGGFAVFTDTVKEESAIGLFSILSFFPCIAIWVICQDKKYRKKILFILFSLAYIVFSLLSGIRWNITLLIIGIIPFLPIKKKNLYLVGIIIVVIVAIFMIATYFRRSTDIINQYYVNTGLYRGDIGAFFATEIFRYFGMCQRLISSFMNYYSPAFFQGKYTVYPIIKFIMPVELPENVWINGYNATNIIGYLYGDFGVIWPFALFVWSFINFYCYSLFLNNQDNLFCRFICSISFISVILSFYCYYQHYVYWLIHMPLILLSVRLFVSFCRPYLYTYKLEGDC